MNSNNHLEYTDEMLSFIYNSAFFQSLNEEDQRTLLSRFIQDSNFFEILNIAYSLQEEIEEVKRTIPPATDELKKYFVPKKKKMLEKMYIEDNVIFVPTERFKKKCGPFVVCLQQGEAMKEVEKFCKGMMLSLFDLCYKQRRDLYIIMFAKSPTILKFEVGQYDVETFTSFIVNHQKGEANLLPALEEALTILNTSTINDQSELMIITNNVFADFNEERLEEISTKLINSQITISAMAMSEETFGIQPLHFLDKVFFVNE